MSSMKKNKKPDGINMFIFYGITISFSLFGLLTLLMNWYDSKVISKTALMEFGFAILFGILGAMIALKQKKSWKNQLETFAFSTESATRTAVLNFPSPMVVVSIGGVIQWHNKKFSELVKKDSLYGEYLQDHLPTLSFGRFIEDTEPTPEEFVFQGRNYLISGRVERTVYEEITHTMVALYFTDITDYGILTKQLEDKKTVVCSVVVDNYNEVLKVTPNANHVAIISDIERCVTQWAERGEGVLVHYERDRFLILFEALKFEPLLKERFGVLEQIKQIQHGNRFPATLSIGVGKSGDTLQENESISRAALDMALGRGGDQAVLKTAKGYQFYGAKSREVEKSNKVKARIVAHALRDLADQAQNIIIMGHRNGDADSLGAAVGLFRAFRNRNADAYIALDLNHNNAQMLLNGLIKDNEYRQRIINEDRGLSMMNPQTLVIVVDTHRASIVECPLILKNAKNIVLIDHHRRSEDFIEDAVLTYHEPYASSSCEMITEIFQYMQDDQRIDCIEAEALYSGIYVDTKGFTFKTGARTFEAASYLRRMGVDPVNVRRLFQNDLRMYIQKSRIISNAKVYRDNIAIAFCEDNERETQIVVAQAADELLDIKGIEAAFVLAAIGGKIIISGRSLDSINVQVILEKLGGGGHITIAGAQLKHNSLSLAEMRLKAAIDEVLLEAEDQTD